MAPVELVGFARRKAQRNIGRRGRLPALLTPTPGVTPYGIVTTVIAAAAKLFEDPDQGQLFARGSGRVRRQQHIELRCPVSKLGPRLNLPLVLKRGLSRPQHLPDRVPGHLQVAGDLLDRLALDEVFATYPRNRPPRSASPTTCFVTKQAAQQTNLQGVNFGRRAPRLEGQYCRPNDRFHDVVLSSKPSIVTGPSRVGRK